MLYYLGYIYIQYHIYICHISLYISELFSHDMFFTFFHVFQRPRVSVHVEVNRATQVRGVEGLNLTWPVADFQITTVRSSRCKKNDEKR